MVTQALDEQGSPAVDSGSKMRQHLEDSNVAGAQKPGPVGRGQTTGAGTVEGNGDKENGPMELA